LIGDSSLQSPSNHQLDVFLKKNFNFLRKRRIQKKVWFFQNIFSVKNV
jgi:hypothetical protein